MVARLTSSARVGTARTLVAVGTASEASMLRAKAPWAPRRGCADGTVGVVETAGSDACGAVSGALLLGGVSGSTASGDDAGVNGAVWGVAPLCGGEVGAGVAVVGGVATPGASKPTSSFAVAVAMVFVATPSGTRSPSKYARQLSGTRRGLAR